MQSDQFLDEGEVVIREQKRCRVKTQRAGSRAVIGSNAAHVTLTNRRLLAMTGRKRLVHVPLTHLQSWEAVKPFRLRSFVHYSGGPFVRIQVVRPDSVVGIQVDHHQDWIEALDQLAMSRSPDGSTRSDHERLAGQAADDAPQPVVGAAEPRHRSRRMGAAIAMLGIVVGVLAALAAVVLFPDVGAYHRASGERAPVELTAGNWTVFVEGGLERPRDIEAPSGAGVELQPISSRQSYSYSGRSGAAVGAISAPTDGTYLVTTAPGVTVAFGQNFGRKLAAAIVVGVIGGLVAVGSLVVGLFTIAASRHRDHQFAAAASWQPRRSSG